MVARGIGHKILCPYNHLCVIGRERFQTVPYLHFILFPIFVPPKCLFMRIFYISIPIRTGTGGLWGKVLLCFSLLLLCFSHGFGQKWLWGRDGTGAPKADESGGFVATDKVGNAYITGDYSNIIITTNRLTP